MKKPKWGIERKCPKCGNKEKNFVVFEKSSFFDGHVWRLVLFGIKSKWYEKDVCGYCEFEWNRFEEV